MQTYHCNHCGKPFETIFQVFLHIFTDHMNTDIGLEKQESLCLLALSRPYCAKCDGGIGRTK